MIIVANTDSNVNRTVTHHLDSRNRPLLLLTHHVSHLRTLGLPGSLSMGMSIASGTSFSTTVTRNRTGFNPISTLVGGTNTVLLNRVSARSTRR